jgi:type I restriction enzyme S subunit
VSTTSPRYPSYRSSGVVWCPEIPEHWQVRRNGGLFYQVNETGFPGLPILEVSLHTGVQVRDMAGGFRKQEMGNRGLYKRALAGDIAYNTMRMWQGAVGVAPTAGLISPAYVVARPFAAANSDYYSYLYRTSAYLGEINRNSRGIVADRNRLYWADFKQISSIAPPLGEQRAIVRYIRGIEIEVNAAVRARRKMVVHLREQKSTLLRELISRSGDSEWAMWRVGHLAKVGNGSTPSRSKPEYWSTGDYPWLNSSQVNRGAINSADQFVTSTALRECHLPRVAPGSVLVAITGQGKTRGMAALLNVEATVNQHIAYITPVRDEADADWIHLIMTVSYNDLRRISDGAGSTKGALTCADLRRYRIPVPPRNVQREIIGQAAQSSALLDATIAAAEREISLLREYVIKLTADIVTGAMDVRSAAAALPEPPPDAPGVNAVAPYGASDDNDLEGLDEDELDGES